MSPNPPRVAVALLCLACAPAGADVLYKSIGPGGVVSFSNLPPDGLPALESLSSRPSSLAGLDPLNEERLRALDAEVQRASQQMDLAERALAVARRPMWTSPDPGRLGVPRMTRADTDRIDFYKRNFIVARQALLGVLQEKRRSAPQTVTATLDSPIARQ